MKWLKTIYRFALLCNIIPAVITDVHSEKCAIEQNIQLRTHYIMACIMCDQNVSGQKYKVY